MAKRSCVFSCEKTLWVTGHPFIARHVYYVLSLVVSFADR